MGDKYTHQKWTKALDNQLLQLIKKEKNLTVISETMGVSISLIQRRLRSLGFIGIKDARDELSKLSL